MGGRFKSVHLDAPLFRPLNAQADGLPIPATYRDQLKPDFLDSSIQYVFVVNVNTGLTAADPTVPPDSLQTNIIEVQGGSLLLNHMLVLPQGGQLSDLVGNTCPAPADCLLQAWANSSLPAVSLPTETPAQCEDTIEIAGMYHKLQLAPGSVRGSVVLVPQMRLDASGGPFPSILLTDSIVIRGFYYSLTICIFGSVNERYRDWPLANVRLLKRAQAGSINTAKNKYGTLKSAHEPLLTYEHKRENPEGKVFI